MSSGRHHSSMLARQLRSFVNHRLVVRTSDAGTALQQSVRQVHRAAQVCNRRRLCTPSQGLRPQGGEGSFQELRKFSSSSIHRPGGPAGPNPRVVKEGDPDSPQAATSTSGEAGSSAGHGPSGASTADAASSSPDEGDASSENERVVDDKTRTLQAALTYVPRLGWTQAALREGAKDVGLSPSIVGAFPRRGAELVEFFMDEALRKLVEEAESKRDELSKMLHRERVTALVRMRLEMLEPYLSKWPQALNIQLNPVNAPRSLKQRAVLIDEIWHLAGDRATNADWYAKRALLGFWYNLSEVYMLTDLSPGFRNTWEFVRKRMDNVVECSKAAQETAHMAQAVTLGLGNTLQSYLKQFARSAF